MSRRDNGLPGADWHPLTELEPPVADHLLHLLAEAGVAAFAEPVTPRSDPYLGTRLPARPLDSVHVPLDALDRARAVLEAARDELAAGSAPAGAPAAPDEPDERPAGPSDDEVWASIVASYSAAPAEPVGRWPAAEDTDDEHDDTSAGSGAATVRPPAPGDGRGTSAAVGLPSGGPATGPTGFEDLRAELDAAAADVPAAPDEEEHYVPPPPPPLGRADDITIAAWACFLGGPLFLLLATLLDWERGGLASFLAVMAGIGGFVTLIARRDDHRDEGDDGARV